MFGKIRPISDQQGFSLAEVAIALILFSATVLGVSSMVMTGAADVARGATDSLAANLAAKRIEEVRSLPFYKAWEGTPKDIDDYYFNTSLEGDNKNSQQLDHPKVVENYGSVPGSTQYKRTTAIQYQQVSSTSMSPAVMATNWVPSNPSASQIDRPRSAGDTLHAMIIEVCVYYRISQGGTQHEIVYKLRALEGDMIIPGGAGVPPLTVTSINPSYGSMSNYNALVKITISSDEPITGGTFDVRLWRANHSDILGKSTSVAGTSEIDTYFDLTQPEVEAGLYNISVYWQERGWLDKNFRNCFTVIQPEPGIDSVDNFNWGTSRQSSRLVTIHGSNLAGPTTVSLEGPAGETTGAGQVVSWNNNTIVTEFNLTSVPPSSKDTRWDVRVVTAGGTYVSNDDNKRVLMNPKPVITSITGGDTTGSGTKFYRKKKYTSVTINGKYFEGAQGGASSTVKLKKIGQADIIDPNVAVGSVTETSDPETGVTSMKLTLNVLNLGLSPGGPFTYQNYLHGNDEIGDWKVVVVNPDAQESTDDVYATVANAPIEITEGWSDQQCWGWDLPLRSVKGKYFDPDNTTVSFLDSNGNDYNPTDPSPATTPIPTLTGAEVPTGTYDGSAQTISGGLLNLINVPEATYKIRVKDTENNQYGDKELVATYQKPGVPYYINPTEVTEGASPTLAVRAKGMYGNCTFTVKFWEMVKHGNDWVHEGDNLQTSNSSQPVTWSRLDKYVQVSSTVDVPVDGPGVYYKTATYEALPEIMVTNTIGDSDYWTGGHPTVN